MATMKTPPVTSAAPARGSRSQSRERWSVPVLCAREGGPAERMADRFRGFHPAIVFALVMLGGLAATAVASIGLGFLLTRVVEHAWGIGAADEHLIVWFAAH